MAFERAAGGSPPASPLGLWSGLTARPLLSHRLSVPRIPLLALSLLDRTHDARPRSEALAATSRCDEALSGGVFGGVVGVVVVPEAPGDSPETTATGAWPPSAASAR